MPRQPLVLSLLLLVLANPFAPCAFAQDQAARITSPDGRIEFRVWSEDGAPRYAVTQDDTMIVRASRLGFRFADSAPLEDDLTLATTQTDSHDESWEQPWGERRIVRDHHNELVASFRRENNPELGFDLRIRVFDSGVGFRYEVIGEAQHAIVDEITRINLPEHSTAWWIPAAGWNRYEYLYQETPLSEVVTFREETGFAQIRREDGARRVAVTAEVVKQAHARGVSVEGELGCLVQIQDALHL